MTTKFLMLWRCANHYCNITLATEYDANAGFASTVPPRAECPSCKGWGWVTP